MPLAVVHVDGAEPDLLLLGPEGVEVVPELQPALLDLEDPVLAVMLVGHPEY